MNGPLLRHLQMKPAVPISAEDRVVQTMELLTDCNLEKEKLQNHVQKWSDLQPSAPGENTPEAQVWLIARDGISDVCLKKDHFYNPRDIIITSWMAVSELGENNINNLLPLAVPL